MACIYFYEYYLHKSVRWGHRPRRRSGTPTYACVRGTRMLGDYVYFRFVCHEPRLDINMEGLHLLGFSAGEIA